MGTAVVMIVVWLGLGSGTTYQVPFSSLQLCEAARKEILDERSKSAGKLARGIAGDDQRGLLNRKRGH